MLFTFYDIETSGLSANCDILSFSYMLADENLRVVRAETLYFWKEGVTAWTEEAYAIHGLSKEFLQQFANEYDTNLRKMYIVLSKAELVGWNSGYIDSDGLIKGFDFPRCKEFLRRNGLPAPYEPIMHDAMRLYSKLRHCSRTRLQVAVDKEGISRALVDAYVTEYFKSSKTRAHDSGYDVVCTAMIFAKIYEAGLVYGNEGEIDLLKDIDTIGLDMWILHIGADGALHVRNEYDNSDYTLVELCGKYPDVYKKIMENPKMYLRQEG